MSLYFRTKITGDTRPVDTVAHTIYSIIATSFANNRVIISTSENYTIAVLTCSCRPTCLSFHPTFPILIVGWADGSLMLWESFSIVNGSYKFSTDLNTTNKSKPQPGNTITEINKGNEGVLLKAPAHDGTEVLKLYWTSGGNVLLSASKSGTIAFWQLEKTTTTVSSQLKRPVDASTNGSEKKHDHNSNINFKEKSSCDYPYHDNNHFSKINDNGKLVQEQHILFITGSTKAEDGVVVDMLHLTTVIESSFVGERGVNSPSGVFEEPMATPVGTYWGDGSAAGSDIAAQKRSPLIATNSMVDMRRGVVGDDEIVFALVLERSRNNIYILNESKRVRLLIPHNASLKIKQMLWDCYNRILVCATEEFGIMSYRIDNELIPYPLLTHIKMDTNLQSNLDLMKVCWAPNNLIAMIACENCVHFCSEDGQLSSLEIPATDVIFLKKSNISTINSSSNKSNSINNSINTSLPSTSYDTSPTGNMLTKPAAIVALVSFTNQNNNAFPYSVSHQERRDTIVAVTTSGRVHIWKLIEEYEMSFVSPVIEEDSLLDFNISPGMGDNNNNNNNIIINNSRLSKRGQEGGGPLWQLVTTIEPAGGVTAAKMTTGEGQSGGGIDVRSPLVLSLRVMSNGGLCVTTTEDVIVMRRAPRVRRWSAPGAMVQTDSETVVVSVTSAHDCKVTGMTGGGASGKDSLSSNAPLVSNKSAVDITGDQNEELATKINSVVKVNQGTICAADLCFPELAIWNGRTLDVYSISEITGTVTLLFSTEYHHSILALHSDGILILSTSGDESSCCIALNSYQRQPYGRLSFLDKDGIPECIDCAGDYVCVVTNLHMMKVARIFNKELRQVGPVRPLKFMIDDHSTMVSHGGPGEGLTPSFSPFCPASSCIKVRSCKMNPAGRFVALLVKMNNITTTGWRYGGGGGPSGAGGARPDLSTRVYVYDLEDDSLKYYDFGHRRQMPEAVFWNTSATSDAFALMGGAASALAPVVGAKMSSGGRGGVLMGGGISAGGSMMGMPSFTLTGGSSDVLNRADGEWALDSLLLAVELRPVFSTGKSLLGLASSSPTEGDEGVTGKKDSVDDFGINANRGSSYKMKEGLSWGGGDSFFSSADGENELTTPIKISSFRIKQQQRDQMKKRRENESKMRLVATLFIALGSVAEVVRSQPDYGGLVLYREIPLRKEQICLVGCCMPYLVFSCVIEPSIASSFKAGGVGGSSSTIHFSTKDSSGVPINLSLAPPQCYALQRDKMVDFRGMESSSLNSSLTSDTQLRAALIQFSYHSTIGNMDEAYRVIKMIKDVAVWKNLARMCITSSRLDVAEVCLANMQDAVAARCLRESVKEAEPETRLGILALVVGMTDEAEELFKRANRSDLVTDLMLANNRWDDALEYIKGHDHIRMTSFFYRRAQYIEKNYQNNLDAAVHLYNEALCAGTDVPRMLLQNNATTDLREHVLRAKMHLKELNKKSGKKSLLGEEELAEDNITQLGREESETLEENRYKNFQRKRDFAKITKNARDLVIWWAQYMETQNRLDVAIRYFEYAYDVFNVVRLLCVRTPPDIEKAAMIVENPDHNEQVGAAFWIGQCYEQKGEPVLALKYYNLAGATKKAARLAKKHEMYGDVVAIALQSSDKSLSLECAKYFYDRQLYEKAVQLYQKGGDVQSAIDTCIKGELFDQLQRIGETIDSAADPDSFLSMAEHFLKANDYIKAVDMLVFAKAYNEALQICATKNVKLTDQMAESMTPMKSEEKEAEKYRMQMLLSIADVARDQGSFHLACKKYTQAGERVKALTMLMKAGDVDKVIFFAQHSRSNEIYVLAANFLQSQAWQEDPKLYKTIVSFYTKAKAFENLVLFYDAYAQVRIDEFRDYDKALLILKEAQCVFDMREGKGTESIAEPKKHSFATRVSIVEQFVNARKEISPGVECPDAIRKCSELITRTTVGHPDRELIESVIRIGDVYALLVEYYERLNKFDEAYKTINHMKAQGIELSYFLDGGIIQKICGKIGRDATPLLGPNGEGGVEKGGKRKGMDANAENGQEEVDVVEEQ